MLTYYCGRNKILVDSSNNHGRSDREKLHMLEHLLLISCHDVHSYCVVPISSLLYLQHYIHPLGRPPFDYLSQKIVTLDFYPKLIQALQFRFQPPIKGNLKEQMC